MRGLFGMALLVGLSACASLQGLPPGYPDSGWRTSRGTPISIAEYDALRQSCLPRRYTLPMDSNQPVPSTIRDNPAYHPGGEGLANAPMTGIVADGQPVEPGLRRSSAYRETPIDECLAEKGLVKVMQ